MDLKEIVNALMMAAKLEAAVGTVNLKEGKSELWAECLFEASDYKRMAREIEQMRCENCVTSATTNGNRECYCSKSIATYGRFVEPDFYCKHYEKR